MTLYRLDREGGNEPSDDEHLEVADDGSFTAWRTVGWTAIGAFAGTLPPDDLASLAAGLRAVPGGETHGEVPRMAAVEQHRAGGASLVIGGSSDPPEAWAVAEIGRGLLEVTAPVAPVGALVLRLDGFEGASLAVVGAEGISLVTGSLRWRAEHLSAEGVVLASWRPTGAEGGPPPEGLRPQDAAVVAPGQIADLTMDHGWSVGADEYVRVWATVGVRRPGSPLARTGRLVAAIPGS